MKLFKIEENRLNKYKMAEKMSDKKRSTLLKRIISYCFDNYKDG